jgi:hypothetical protein
VAEVDLELGWVCRAGMKVVKSCLTLFDAKIDACCDGEVVLVSLK